MQRSDRQQAGREKRDVVFPLPTPDDLIEDVLEEPVRILRRLAECSNDRVETVVDGLAAALDQPVGVEENDRAGRELDRLLAVLRCESRCQAVDRDRPRAARFARRGNATIGGGWPADARRQTPVAGSSTRYTTVANAVSSTSFASRLSRASVDGGFRRSTENARIALRSCDMLAAA